MDFLEKCKSVVGFDDLSLSLASSIEEKQSVSTMVDIIFMQIPEKISLNLNPMKLL